METYRVRNSFLFPTALKMIMKAVPEPRQNHALHLRSIMSAGEAVGTTVFAVMFEAGYLLTSAPPYDGLGYLIGRDFVNTWMGAHSAFAGGPAAWFDFDTYNAALAARKGRPGRAPCSSLAYCCTRSPSKSRSTSTGPATMRSRYPACGCGRV